MAPTSLITSSKSAGPQTKFSKSHEIRGVKEEESPP